MNQRLMLLCLAFLIILQPIRSQERRPAIDSQVGDTPDSSATAMIIEEGTKHSQVMEMLSYIADVRSEEHTSELQSQR